MNFFRSNKTKQEQPPASDIKATKVMTNPFLPFFQTAAACAA